VAARVLESLGADPNNIRTQVYLLFLVMVDSFEVKIMQAVIFCMMCRS
jgi:hypothetical protein